MAVLLVTARVLMMDRFGVRHAARALIDQGSETSLIAESLTQRFRLARTPTAVAIYGMGGMQTGVSRDRVVVIVSSPRTNTTLTISALVLPRLSAYNGAIERAPTAWTHIRDLGLMSMASSRCRTCVAVDLRSRSRSSRLSDGSS